MGAPYKQTLDTDLYISNYPTIRRGFSDRPEEEVKELCIGGALPGNMKKSLAGQKAALRLRKVGHPDFIKFQSKEEQIKP